MRVFWAKLRPLHKASGDLNFLASAFIFFSFFVLRFFKKLSFVGSAFFELQKKHAEYVSSEVQVINYHF